MLYDISMGKTVIRVELSFGNIFALMGRGTFIDS